MSKTMLCVYRRGSAMFPHYVDLELADGLYRPTEAVEIGPEDTFAIERHYEPQVTPERAERDAAARAFGMTGEST